MEKYEKSYGMRKILKPNNNSKHKAKESVDTGRTKNPENLPDYHSNMPKDRSHLMNGLKK